MPNLNLTHSGNMNITSASLASAGTLNVQYGPNNTGAVTGFTFSPPEGSEFVCGDTYTITAIPKFSGNVLTETFTVSGVDIAGVLRSDNSVLRQGIDSDLTHYELNLASVGATIISSSVTSTYLELEISIDNDEYAEIDIQPGSGEVIVYPIDNIKGGDEPIVIATSITIVVDSTITDSGFATSTYSPSGAMVSLVYSSSDESIAVINPLTGEITVLSEGYVELCVTDTISNLSDCKTVMALCNVTGATEYLTFEIETGGSFGWYTPSSENMSGHTIEYKKNNEEWRSIDSAVSPIPLITVNSGDIVKFRGNNTTYYYDGTHYSRFIMSNDGLRFKIKGNIMSLIESEGFETAITLSNNAFYYLFQNTFVTDASELLLRSVSENCYHSMFRNCQYLTTGPRLFVKKLAPYCYSQMFDGCTSLTTAPALPATTLANYCYSNMFRGCTSLTSLPALPATTLANRCYEHMFNGCTSLTTVPSNYLPAITLAGGCYTSMFYNCTSLTKAPELPATTLADSCYSAMFRGCTSLTSLPELPATALTQRCYSYMFYGCTSLTTVPSNYLPATALTDYCYEQMFRNCTSLTTAPDLPAKTLTYCSYFYMFAGCTSLNYIKCLATKISATNCTKNWVDGVDSSGTFVKVSSMASWTTGVNGIPSGWTVQNAS